MHSIKIIIYRSFSGQGLSIYRDFLSVAKSYLYMYNVKYLVNISHLLVYSFIVFNPMERKLHLRENWLIFWGDLGRS